MESKTIDLNQLQSRTVELEQLFSKMNMGEVFTEKKGSYLNEFTLFLALFNSIPNFIHEINIDCKKADKWFFENYKGEIRDLYFDKRYFNDSKNAEYDDIFYILFDDLIVDFDTNLSEARFLFRKTDISKVEILIGEIKKFRERKEKRKPEISLLVTTQHGIGTGKTSYIRYLISTLKKNVIFLPPNMASAIINPDLISILIDNPNSIFVIEDAENIVVDREKDGHSPVSALLNISDGLLSDCLNIQVICSFNTDISKGRLIAKYEFKELEIEKATMLSHKLGFTTSFNSPVTLTAIYNQEEKDFQETKKFNTIGFKAILTNES